MSNLTVTNDDLQKLWTKVVNARTGPSCVSSDDIILEIEEITNGLKKTAVHCLPIWDAEGILAGVAVLCLNEQKLKRHTATVDPFVISPSHKGSGVERQLLKDVEEFARKKCIESIIMCVEENLLEMYTSLGFKKVGCTPEGVLNADGQYADLYYMWFPLEKK